MRDKNGWERRRKRKKGNERMECERGTREGQGKENEMGERIERVVREMRGRGGLRGRMGMKGWFQGE